MFQPGDRVWVDSEKVPQWKSFGPWATVQGVREEEISAGRPRGSASKSCYTIRFDGFTYHSDRDYHTAHHSIVHAGVQDDEVEAAIASILGGAPLMPKPKLEVNEVWILEEVLPYEGAWVQGVFVDVEVAKAGRKGWRQLPDGDWTNAPIKESTKEFFTVTKHTIRRK